MGNRLLLYVHIPYCIHHCRFCDACVLVGSSEQKQRYLEALTREIDSARDELAEYSVAGIYVGGGSPTVMRPDSVALMVRRLKKLVNLERSAEVTIEVMPQTVGTPLLTGLNPGGFTRYSLSVQSVIPQELQAIDAGFTVQDVQNAVLFLDRFRHNNVNLDLMYGIPEQTLRTWERTLHAVRDFNPGHVSVYPFKGNAAVEVGAADAADDTGAADDMIAFASEYLPSLGLQRYSTNHFAKPNRHSTYHQNRLNGMDYRGFGLGARSLVEGIAFENTLNLTTYLEHSADFETITTNIIKLTNLQ
ncbi:MAG: radical SAM protein [Coriobacteriales bacterium]|jgi:oxygen-independent coproporphyrinogen-3 oxidase|nr:radical SAM protein [Coriobacteriales bacterium]